MFNWAVKPNIFRLLPSNCLNWKIYCQDHSSLSSTTAVQIWISYIFQNSILINNDHNNNLIVEDQWVFNSKLQALLKVVKWECIVKFSLLFCSRVSLLFASVISNFWNAQPLIFRNITQLTLENTNKTTISFKLKIILSWIALNYMHTALSKHHKASSTPSCLITTMPLLQTKMKNKAFSIPYLSRSPFWSQKNMFLLFLNENISWKTSLLP